MLNTNTGYVVGRLAGVEIKINPSLLFIAVLITVQVISLLRAVLPTYAPLVYVLMGILTAALFIGSVLWHEMAHVMMAQRYGIPVLQVVLHMFGGVALISRDAERPREELIIAAAGPASSFLLAFIFGIASTIPGIGGVVATILAQVNLTLGLFNLIPGFPMDGGRILRAILWWRTGSYKTATRLASRVAVWVAGGFAFLAIFLVFEGAWFNGLWLLLIAYFVYQTATVSANAVRSPQLSLSTPVSKLMRHPPNLIEADKPIALLAFRYFDRDRDQAVIAMSNNELVGLVTYLDIERYPRLEWGKIHVADVMQPRDKIIVLHPEETVKAALEQFDRTNTSYAPVMHADAPVGIVFRRDIAYRVETKPSGSR